MKIGLIADMHLGYTRGTRDNDEGVNVREQDVIDAAQTAVNNLVEWKVEAIVDLGDMFHVPAPKKRALLAMVHMINESGLPWFSANGNHTLQRTRSDLHVYDVLVDLCHNFHGYTIPSLVADIGGYFIPYGTEVSALLDIPDGTKFLAGHFACDDVPFPGEHVSAKDLNFWPVFLGHYHTRTFHPTPDEWWEGPMYIGATERFAWGEATNPTGVAVYNTETNDIEFINHETREWADITASASEVLDVLRTRDFEGKIVRVNVEGTPAEYHGLDIKAIRDIAKGSLEFQVRRVGSTETFAPDTTDTQTYSLLDAWGHHVSSLMIPKARREHVRTIGERALASAGVGE